MKTQRISSKKTGFTLVELLVAMFITTIIISVLVGITSIALDTWNRSRSELRAARQAKAMIDTMARDLESLVTRKGNTNEWLSAIADDSSIGQNLTSTNATKLIFFTAATDRYDGNIGGSDDRGGDVSCVAYQLEYKDPIGSTGAAGGTFDTFVLNRLLVNPDETFDKLLGETQTDPNKNVSTLEDVFNQNFSQDISDEQNFVCENIYQFSVTFYVQTSETSGGANPTTEVKNHLVKVDKNNNSFRILGTGIETEAPAGVTPATFAAGRVTAVQISTTVLSDFGVDQAKKRSFASDEAKAKFFSQNSFEYSKIIQIPSM
ncbi:prepilin-type N-terminal cleavage/methylation domain-containing protein [Luteolibacter yonseiensis]|uniref:Prepilin-type N-terminal cleavage/methylation domain-containing protein n=1 Tax=Luteolibacter yonseiensis TaxID=1144680 RepID=A0A934VE00_9BACT|nr:prepilin-type N-terminal cleavage/methylation domain-containing protein [Luteolibacter yonseiensis]MBK1818094.1 prepilin-type N-terminal cleavage/methylation domain-containing protein [Luteolibacter yonseiensis]